MLVGGAAVTQARLIAGISELVRSRLELAGRDPGSMQRPGQEPLYDTLTVPSSSH
jgi:hypothetical protein